MRWTSSKEFDFLDAEHDSVLESVDSCFNWLNRPRSISNAATSQDDGAISPSRQAVVLSRRSSAQRLAT